MRWLKPRRTADGPQGPKLRKWPTPMTGAQLRADPHGGGCASLDPHEGGSASPETQRSGSPGRRGTCRAGTDSPEWSREVRDTTALSAGANGEWATDPARADSGGGTAWICYQSPPAPGYGRRTRQGRCGVKAWRRGTRKPGGNRVGRRISRLRPDTGRILSEDVRKGPPLSGQKGVESRLTPALCSFPLYLSLPCKSSPLGL